MIVLDASAVLEVLLRTAQGRTIEERIFHPDESMHAPHLLDLEVAQVCRRYCLRRVMSRRRGKEALTDLSDLPIERYPHLPLLGRAWELYPNLTVYDAIYVALAEALRAPLLTRDARLAAAPGHSALIELV
ncbi:type II toxin-antitoxin system VapC family toxin [Methylacidimicrobium sp. B4]|uniref:type II toxin-antitoxin system VapC family toxin n=1 Tax=Methylacidimicrobium sp. B4 TaxID=2796139 RepID=UPI001A8F9DBB|nr:type II toxin-antitoxin system VapC family toxin [Methylacidimicrobium sp. B4]QSR85225.1 type II toxin-antitoxin system VapC family toxin [Methylacidimicrobium sp. B4]